MSEPKQTERIKGFDAKLFRATDPPVYLLPDGRFAMFWSVGWKIKPSIKQLDDLLKRHNASIKIMRFDDPSGSISIGDFEALEAVAWEKSFITKKDGSARVRSWGGHDWYLYDAKVEKAVQSVIAKAKELEKHVSKELANLRNEYERATKRAITVNRGNFQQFVAAKDEPRPRGKVRRAGS
jgi:hypothetical protein